MRRRMAFFSFWSRSRNHHSPWRSKNASTASSDAPFGPSNGRPRFSSTAPPRARHRRGGPRSPRGGGAQKAALSLEQHPPCPIARLKPARHRCPIDLSAFFRREPHREDGALALALGQRRAPRTFRFAALMPPPRAPPRGHPGGVRASPPEAGGVLVQRVDRRERLPRDRPGAPRGSSSRICAATSTIATRIAPPRASSAATAWRRASSSAKAMAPRSRATPGESSKRRPSPRFLNGSIWRTTWRQFPNPSDRWTYSKPKSQIDYLLCSPALMERFTRGGSSGGVCTTRPGSRTMPSLPSPARRKAR